MNREKSEKCVSHPFPPFFLFFFQLATRAAASCGLESACTGQPWRLTDHSTAAKHTVRSREEREEKRKGLCILFPSFSFFPSVPPSPLFFRDMLRHPLTCLVVVRTLYEVTGLGKSTGDGVPASQRPKFGRVHSGKGP